MCLGNGWGEEGGGGGGVRRITVIAGGRLRGQETIEGKEDN